MTIKFSKILLTLAACMPLTAFAQSNPPFFSIKSGAARAYILGTVHLAPQESAPLPTKIINALNVSDTFIHEAEGKFISNSSRQDSIGNLSENLSQIDFQFAKITLENYGYKIDKTSTGDFVGTAFLIYTLNLQNNGFLYKNNIENRLLMLAKQKSKKTNYLISNDETNASLETKYAHIDRHDALAYLKCQIELSRNGTSTKSFSIEYEKWADGNVAGMLNENAAWSSIYSECLTKKYNADGANRQIIFDNFIKKSNYIFAKKIAEYLNSEGTYFITMGAAHLDGVFELLRDRGYVIENEMSPR